MTIDLKIKIENGAVTITVGGQPLQVNSQAARLGQVQTSKVLGAGSAPNEAGTDTGSAPNEANTDTGGAAGSGAVVIVPIVMSGGGAGAATTRPANADPAKA